MVREREKQKKGEHQTCYFYLQAQGVAVQPTLVAGELICAQGFLVMQLCW